VRNVTPCSTGVVNIAKPELFLSPIPIEINTGLNHKWDRVDDFRMQEYEAVREYADFAETVERASGARDFVTSLYFDKSLYENLA
jgi:hypothetical protein